MPPFTGKCPEGKGGANYPLHTAPFKTRSSAQLTESHYETQHLYDPESDTLDIGNGKSGSEGQPVADRLTAFFGDGEDAVGITLENAVELLAPCLKESASGRTDVSRRATTSTDLQIHYFPQTDTLDLGNGMPAAEGYDIANVRDDGELVGITLEHAAEMLVPYLRDQVSIPETSAPWNLNETNGL